ncbi:MAG: hypothetical protein H6855_04270 [Rhodospirillales bacterium]|nr:hypothetical protein [Rhodospirillales bacterium]
MKKIANFAMMAIFCLSLSGCTRSIIDFPFDLMSCAGAVVPFGGTQCSLIPPLIGPTASSKKQPSFSRSYDNYMVRNYKPPKLTAPRKTWGD